MSFLSLTLPRKWRSDSLRSSNSSVDQNVKCTTLNNRRSLRNSVLSNGYSTLSLQVPPRKRILNRNGSISANHFRGVHKSLLEDHADAVCHTMTVSIWMLNRSPICSVSVCMYVYVAMSLWPERLFFCLLWYGVYNQYWKVLGR